MSKVMVMDPQKGNGYKGFQRDDQRNRNDDLL